MFRVPNKEKKFAQLNQGDALGNVFSTKNIDFNSNRGRIGVSPRLKVAVKDNDSAISNMGVPLAIVAHDTGSGIQYYAACGIGAALANGTGTILKSDDADFDSDWDNDAIASTPTDVSAAHSDMVEWKQKLYVTTFSTTSKMKELFTSWNATYHTTASITFKTNGGLKNLCVGFNNNLYFTDDDEVNFVNTSDVATQSGAGTLNFLGLYRPIWIRSSSNRLWIGLMSFDAAEGSRGYVAEWDGVGTAANRLYDMNVPSVLSCTILNDVPYIIDAYGVLKKYVGYGFQEVARLPVANQAIEMPGIYEDLTNVRWIHQRGMDVVDGKINIVVNNLVSTGVYVEDMPSGVWEYDEEIGLYHKNSPCATTTDYGQQIISTAGAIYGTKRTEGAYLAGFGYYTDATTERKGVFYDDVVSNNNKIGQITTPFLMSEEIDDNWQKVIYRSDPLQPGDSIKGKYRAKTSVDYPILITLTWTATNAFTTTSDMSDCLGYEVEVVQGLGASQTSTITEIVDISGTYHVTVDDTYTGATGTSKAYITNFKKLGIIEQDDAVFGELAITGDDNNVATKIQIKTDLKFTGDTELDDITVVNSTHQKL